MRSGGAVILLAFLSLPLLADANDDPMSSALRRFYENAKGNILAAAERMPEGEYAYRPTPGVRAFGELLGHIADGQYVFCSAVQGDPNPIPVDASLTRIHPESIEKTKTSKVELRKALQAAFDYCDAAFAEVSDPVLGETVQLLNNPTSKATTLTLSVYHLSNHYGNLATYMRLKDVVPPSAPEAARGSAAPAPPQAPARENAPAVAELELATYQLVLLKRPSSAP